MGAGILPVAILNGSIFLLLGKERFNNLWCDFGGTPNKGETPYKTAIRECSEELNGLLGTEKEVRDLVNKNKIMSINYDSYTSYLVKIDYSDKFPEYFNNLNKFAEKHLKSSIHKKNGLFEKTEIKWFDISDFKNQENNKILRPHYVEIMETIIKNKNEIKANM